MKNLVFVIGLIQVFYIYTCHAQRVAPGVPPQNYQQQQQQYQPQQFQQQPQYQQQQQQQYQQVPVQQQQQVPVQHQQVPVQQQVPIQQQVPQNTHHAHHGAPQPGQVLNAANIQHEKEHIAEHLDVPIDTSKMTEQELQLHYFKMHDADNNNKLDGCELIKSLIHWHGSETDENAVSYSDSQLSETIDHLFSFMDVNKDGYVEYTEFKLNANNV